MEYHVTPGMVMELSSITASSFACFCSIGSNKNLIIHCELQIICNITTIFQWPYMNEAFSFIWLDLFSDLCYFLLSKCMPLGQKACEDRQQQIHRTHWVPLAASGRESRKKNLDALGCRVLTRRNCTGAGLRN